MSNPMTIKHKTIKNDIKGLLEMTQPKVDEVEDLIVTDEELELAEKLKNLGIQEYNFDSKAYPNTDPYDQIRKIPDQSKWIEAAKQIYYYEKNGLAKKVAVVKATKQWEEQEVFDFINWLRFYEGNNHIKYKFASYVDSDLPGYWLHNKPDPKDNSHLDMDMAKDPSFEEMSVIEKSKIIQKQKQKIIGRLDSIEKLFRSPEGQLFIGKEFENLIDSLYQLKKKIHMLNKKSASIRTYEDLIIREANKLTSKGFIKAAGALMKVAQDMPSPAPPAAPTQGSGAEGGPSVGLEAGLQPVNIGDNANSISTESKSVGNDAGNNIPDTNKMPGEPIPPMPLNKKEEAPKPIQEFLKRLNDGNQTELEDNDNLEVHDSDDELKVDDSTEEDLMVEDDLVSTAQALDVETPEKTVSPKLDAPPVASTDSVTPTTPSSKFDQNIDALFQHVTVQDVINKLEDLAKIFKTREIPRQLNIVDMMLDSLGFAAYFPTLSEATNKALESNNYISSRVEDILSKLRGSVNTHAVDLKGENTPVSQDPNAESIKNNLIKDKEQEDKKRKMRKDLENEALKEQVKEVPEIEVTDEEPVAAEPATPLPPVAPPAKPIAPAV